jgi:hypothetical protein
MRKQGTLQFFILVCLRSERTNVGQGAFLIHSLKGIRHHNDCEYKTDHIRNGSCV